jgi:hypothetical protein
MVGLEKNLILEAKRSGEEKATRIIKMISKEYETAETVTSAEILVLTSCVSAALLAPLIKELIKKGDEQKIRGTMKAYFKLVKLYMEKFIG